MLYFKDYICVIDLTHDHACVPDGDRAVYIGHRVTPSLNDLVICDFIMCFTIIFVGVGRVNDDIWLLKNTMQDKYSNLPYL